jgi:hypothetical protein
MSLPHVVFLALMAGMMTVQVAAALGGRGRWNMTMNWFCQAHLLINLLDHTFICTALSGVMNRTYEPRIHTVPSETQDF